MNRKFCLAGCGRAGLAISLALKAKGWRCGGVWSRKKSSASLGQKLLNSRIVPLKKIPDFSDIIIIAVSDNAISTIAGKIGDNYTNLKGKTFFHLSGSLPSNVLESLKKKGASVLSLHPLIVLPDFKKGKKNILSKPLFTIEGDKNAIQKGYFIVRELGGLSFCIKPDFKSSYHAVAVICSNGIIGLIDYAIGYYKKIGMKKTIAKKAIVRLIESTIDSAKTHPIGDSLTGPVERGDIAVIESHCRSLQSSYEALNSYLSISELILSIAKKKYPERKTLYSNLAKVLKKWHTKD